MIVIDTNVISETLRLAADPRVVAWLDAQPAPTVFLTAVSFAELRLGAALLPKGKRRTALEEAINTRVAGFFDGRILPFDVSAARSFATIMAASRAAGYVIGMADGQIASIAATRGFTVATRDTAPFLAAGLTVINPWQD